MRQHLQKFTHFANTLLPHETAYLLATQCFEDTQRLEILQRVDCNSREIEQFTPYDPSIDKRKYSHLQNWIQERLQAIDVDHQHDWMLHMERKIMTDTIEREEEKKLLKSVRQYEHPSFFFIRFYEVLLHYRHFLLIRIRHQDYQLVNNWLLQYEAAYQQAKACYERLHEATKDVVNQYASGNNESVQWLTWLEKVFLDEQMDGLNRYLAFVRLTFIGFNYQDYTQIRQHFDVLDQAFLTGQHYSKRILANYYSNRLLLHARFKEYKRAVFYGKLSIRANNHDYLFYVNNLAAVQLRLGQTAEALELLKAAFPRAKTTTSMHSRIGHVAFYMEALLKNGQYKSAESFGNTFLLAYSKEILQYRWHLFFSTYLQAMLLVQQPEKCLKIARKYRLIEKDKLYHKKANYLPNIPILLAIAKWREGMLSDAELQLETKSLLQEVAAHQSYQDQSYQERLRYFLQDLHFYFPDLLFRDLFFRGG